MSMFHSEDIDTDVERMLCWGIVQSDAILSQVVGILSPNLFVAETTQYIVKWCIEYYHTYRHAPREHIFDILDEERKKYLREDVAEVLERQLQVISNIDDDTPNKDYVLKRVETYIKERTASMLCEDVSALLSKGQVQAAEERLATYKCPSKPIAMGESIFSPEFWDEREEEKQELFRLSGALGDLIGPIERDSFISLIASEKVGKCIHSDSLILLEDGRLKPIWQVVRDRDEYVLSFDEEKREFVAGRVTEWWDNGEKDCLRVRFKSGRSVTVTPNHPFLSPTGWVPIAEIGVGGFVANPKKLTIQGASKPAHMMRLLGYMLADGGLTKPSTPTWTKKDTETLHDFCQCVSLMGASVTQGSHDSCTYYIVKEKGQRTNPVQELLRECGLLGKKSTEKHVPEMVLTADNSSVAEFLCGLYSGDGWVTKRQIGLGLSNRGVIVTVQSLLLRFGVVSTVYEKKRNSWHLLICGSENLVRFSEQIRLVSYKQQRIDTYLSKWRSMPRKSFIDRIPPQVATECIEAVHAWTKRNGISIVKQAWYSTYRELCYQTNKGNPTMRQGWFALAEIPAVQAMLDDAVLWDEIVSVEDAPNEHTYDLSVEHHHNFVAENCLVHNTWYLMYLALEALRARRNVLFISAGDMTRKQVRARLKHMLTERDPKKQRALVRRPVMDCYYNQIGDCPLGKETSSLIGYEEGASIEDFPDHKVCRACVSDPKNKKHYIGKPWYAMYDPGDTSIEEGYKRIQKQAMSGQFRVMCVPPRTLSVAQIEAQLDLYQQEGFVPDVIVVDYADILDDEPGSHKEDMRNRINISWMAMRRLSQERNCAFITATQAKLEARKKARVDQWDTSEDKRKLAHVTAMLALNQTPAEKRDGIMRVSVLAAREMDFDTEYNVEVLQCLELGRPVLYSYPHRDPPKENRKTSTNKERRNY